MGEAFISRRGGGGSSNNKSNIFMQTSTPPSNSGGLWIKTGLQKVAFSTSIVPSGGNINMNNVKATCGAALNDNLFYYMNVDNVPNTTFFVYNRSSNTTSQLANVYKFDSWYVHTGIGHSDHNNTITFYYSVIYYSSRIDTAYKIVYSVSSNIWSGDKNTPSINYEVSKNKMAYCWGNSNPSILYTNRSNQDTARSNLWATNVPSNITSTLPSSPTFMGVGCMCEVGNVLYICTAGRYSENTLSFKFNITTSTYTQIAKFPLDTPAGQQNPASAQQGAYYNGNIYMQIGNIFGAYSINTNTYTIISTIGSLGQMAYVYANSYYTCQAQGQSKRFYIAGSQTATNTAYVSTGMINKNMSRVAVSKFGNVDVPIQGVYSMQGGFLKPLESYVSTGGGWAKVTY